MRWTKWRGNDDKFALPLSARDSGRNDYGFLTKRSGHRAMDAVSAPSRNAAAVGYSRRSSPNPTVRPIPGRNHPPKIALVMPTTTFTKRPTPRPLVIPVLNHPRKIPTKMQAATLVCGTNPPDRGGRRGIGREPRSCVTLKGPLKRCRIRRDRRCIGDLFLHVLPWD
ncbi:MAG: hypothetical protein JWQ49_2888 [Edaphobacter sp.]|nr:hypothetical protein [Edaphobacter sp.]